MLAPDGTLCQIPDDQVEAAKAEGFKVMTDAHLQRMHNRLFFAQKFFEQKHPRATAIRLPRGTGRW